MALFATLGGGPAIMGQDPNIFPVYIKTITLYNRGRKLKIDIEFVLKQFFTGATPATSMINTREDFFNKLKVLIVVSGDDTVSRNIFGNRDSLKNYLNSNNNNSLVDRGVYGFDEVGLANNKAVQEAVTSAKTAQQYGVLFGSDLLYRKTFTLPVSDPAYLSIFAAPFIDLNDDNDTNHISSQDVSLGKIASELVIKKSQLNLETNLFYLKSVKSVNAQGDVINVMVEDDRIWTGEVHQNGLGEWYTGDGSNGNGFPLRAKKITNSKIADQRNLARIERIEFNFNKLNSLTTTNKTIRDRLKALESIKKQKPSYLSPLYFAKNENNDLSLYFGFDYLEAIVNGAKYQALCTEISDKLSSCDVISTRVIRRRVNKPNLFNRLTGADSPLRIYDNKIEVIGAPTRKDYNTTTGVKQYVIRDEKMKDITTGLYEYGFEITILDNSRARLLNLLTSPSAVDPGIDLIVTDLENFLTESLLKGNYNITTNQYTPRFRERIKSGKAQSGLYASVGGQGVVDYSASQVAEAVQGTAALATRRLGGQGTVIGGEQAFLEYEASSQKVNLAKGPWQTGVDKYTSALRFLSITPSLKDMTNLAIATNPLISGPAGIEYLIRLLKDFSSSLRSAIGISKGSRTTMSQAPASPTGLGKRVFTIRQFFLEAVNADQLHDYGLDFLNLPGRDPGSKSVLKEVTINHWKELMDIQAGKDQGITVEDATYLTPNYLRLPGRTPIDLNPGEEDDETKNQITAAFYKLLYANMHANSPIMLLDTPGSRPPHTESRLLAHTDVGVAQQQNALLNQNGCTVTIFQATSQDPITNVFGTPVMKGTLDASSPMSQTSEFIIEEETQAANDSVSGSSAINLLRPGAGASTANLETSLVANASLISNYLTQGDFFNGKANPAVPPLKTFSSNNYFRGNMSISAVRSQINDRNILADDRPAPISNSPIFTNPSSVDSGLRPSPTEEAFVAKAFSKNTIEPADTALLAAKYGFIYQVEYMATYMIGGVGAMVSTPIWAPLAKSVWENAANTQRSLVCRLKKYKSYLATFDGLKMPIYSEIFILGDTDSTLDLPEATSGENIPPYILPPSLVNNINEFSDSVEFANSYDTDTRVSTRPDPASRRAREARAHSRSTTLLTKSQRIQAYVSFYRWYTALGPDGTRRWQTGSRTGNAWPPPLGGSSLPERAVRTLKMLWYGWQAPMTTGRSGQDRDVIELYEKQTGKKIPQHVFNKDEPVHRAGVQLDY